MQHIERFDSREAERREGVDTAVRALAHKAKLNGYAIDAERVSVLTAYKLLST